MPWSRPIGPVGLAAGAASRVEPRGALWAEAVRAARAATAPSVASPARGLVAVVAAFEPSAVVGCGSGSWSRAVEGGAADLGRRRAPDFIAASAMQTAKEWDVFAFLDGPARRLLRRHGVAPRAEGGAETEAILQLARVKRRGVCPTGWETRP